MTDLKAIRIVPGQKISHDYWGDTVTTFSYRDLIERNIHHVGIPAKQNDLIIVDVDVPGKSHKHDGRPWWTHFTKTHSIPDTYTVQSPSGGLHFYFRLPSYVNKVTFSPPARLAQGVDLKYNGWVGAPPTPGYEVLKGNVSLIAEAPESLMGYISDLIKSKPQMTVDVDSGDIVSLELHTKFSDRQVLELRDRLVWVQSHGAPSYDEWRDGIFSIKSGARNDEEGLELVRMWTHNARYSPGDEELAEKMYLNASEQGRIGPGSIFVYINEMMKRTQSVTAESPFTIGEIIDRSGIVFQPDKSGALRCPNTESNVARIIGAIYGEDELFYNRRNSQVIFKGEPASERDIVNLITPMIQTPGVGLGLDYFKKVTISSGLEVLLASRRIDPHFKWLNSLKWDGVPRVEKFFSTYCNVEDSVYTRRVAMNLWTSLAARGLKPGTKIDSMVILEGDEGVRKSSLCRAIGGEYTYAPSNKQCFSDKDELRQMHQSVVVELPELIGLMGQTGQQVKNFLAKDTDDIRGMYELRAMKNPRGFIFIGTTNDMTYLTADMGHRRFWPIKIPKGAKAINLHGIEAFRDQLFAEGIHLFQSGFKFYEMPYSLLGEQVSRRLRFDPLTSAITSSVKTFNSRFTILDIYRMCETGGLMSRGLTDAVAKRIEDVLMVLGCSVDYDGVEQFWSKPEEKKADLSDFI